MGEQPHRRTTRVLLKVPIEVSGTGADGQPFQEKTSTLMVDGHGAQILLKSLPQAGERVTITNLRSRKSCPFLVVRRVSKSLSQEGEWAVECLQPGTSFWGIHFPAPEPPSPAVSEPATPGIDKPKAPPAAEPEGIEALLACGQCGSQELTRLTIEQYRTLGREASLERECMKCGAVTDWTYSYVSPGDEIPAASLPAAPHRGSKGGIERRKSKRLSVKLPVRIRWDDGREEVTKTEDLSKTGVCFVSETKMNVGDIIRVTVGFGGPGRHTELRGRVVRTQPVAGTNRTLYGVHMEESS